MNNFLSHTDTNLEFSPGITVFVGHNGSGKSSIIDSITFALFNEHTRKTNKNLITRGLGGYVSNETGSFVIMDFSIGSNAYRIRRQIDTQGRLVSTQLDSLVKPKEVKKISEKNVMSTRPVISGERKQLGESVIREVETILGIGYSKLQVAGIIHQGEISKIIDSQPKEFKELLNNMIGLDRLDRSFIHMHNIIEELRILLREKTGGYDDNHINILMKKLNENGSKLVSSKKSLESVIVELAKKTNEFIEMEKTIDALQPKIVKLGELRTLENTLSSYFKEKSISCKKEIEKLNNMISVVNNSVSVLKDKDEIFVTVQMVISEKEELNNELNRLESEIGKLNGFTECAKKIQIKDGRCPVCNSEISVINQMFDISHISKELDIKIMKKKTVFSELAKLNKEETLLKQKERNIIAAEKTFLAYGLSSATDVTILKDKLSDLNKDLLDLSKIKYGDLRNTELNDYRIDDYSTNLIDQILEIRKDVVDVDSSSIDKQKIAKNKLSSDIMNIQNRKAILEKTISDIINENDEIQKLISDLLSASKFISDLEKIRSMVFNRDGVVSSSLRTRALNLISIKASEYVNTFNVGISKITLVEKPREIKVLCYGKRGEIDIFSLSGGEKVAVSLAVRLGIAFLMGSSKIDFVILDEPTTNLDEERRRSFVKIISDVFNKGPGPLSQMIIITHDEEIFENSEIEQVYKFNMTDKGSSVNLI